MRTVKIENKEEIAEIIKSCRTCFLGMADENGAPYVLPMNFGFNGTEIILHSAPEGRMVETLKSNPKVCVTFCQGDELAYMHEQVACSYRVKSKTVVAEGTVRFVTDFDEKEQYLHQMMKQYSNREFKFGAPAVKNVCIAVMPIDTVGAREFGAPPTADWTR